MRAVRNLSSAAKDLFQKSSFEVKNIGMLISSSVMGIKSPEKTLALLEEVLFGHADQVGIVVKSLLIGKEEFLARIDLLSKALGEP